MWWEDRKDTRHTSVKAEFIAFGDNSVVGSEGTKILNVQFGVGPKMISLNKIENLIL